MNLKSSFLQHVNVWLSVLFAVVGAAISIRFITGLPNALWWQSIYVFVAASGVFFIGHFLLQTLLVWPIGCLNAKAGKGAALLLTFVLLTALVTDTFVYQQYRFHLNWPMIDLAIIGGREVFSFSSGMMLRIALLTGAVALLAGLLLWLSSVFQRKIRVRWFCAAILLGYVVVNGVNAYSVSQSVRSVTVLTERIPLYYPIRANRLLAKFGLVAVKEDNVKLSSQEGSFRYPLHPLQLGKGTDLNVLILAIDSLRSDVVDEKTMPNLTRIKSQSISFADHYSAGNATRAGVFGLFYGLPPFYWQSALSTNIPSAMVSGFQQAGYEIEAFTTASLMRPEFYATVFANVRPIRMGADQGSTAPERDMDSVNDFEAWLDTLGVDKKFMSFMFLDNLHANAFPEDLDVPYKNYWKEVNQLELDPDFDPQPYFNRYKNSAFWQDVLIGRVFKILEKKGKLENTIVVVTSDHGEYFNDSKLNYWGHNGNFSQAQIKIPLVIHWPGMAPQELKHRTTAYDVSATLLKRVLGVQNATEDYSVGTDLFQSGGREAFFVGSYNEDAIVSGDEVLLIKMSGAMQSHRLKDWQEIESSEVKKWVPAYLQMRGKYRQ